MLISVVVTLIYTALPIYHSNVIFFFTNIVKISSFTFICIKKSNKITITFTSLKKITFA